MQKYYYSNIYLLLRVLCPQGPLYCSLSQQGRHLWSRPHEALQKHNQCQIQVQLSVIVNVKPRFAKSFPLSVTLIYGQLSCRAQLHLFVQSSETQMVFKNDVCQVTECFQAQHREVK